jgi:hypothetical protein
MKSHLCDVAKHEREKLFVVKPVLLILAPVSKASNFVAYREPLLSSTSKLNQVQYETLLQKIHHDVADWNRILTAVKVVIFDDESELQEVKTRAAKKSELGMALCLTRRLRSLEVKLSWRLNCCFILIQLTGPDSVLCELKMLGKLSTCKALHGMHWWSTLTCWKYGYLRCNAWCHKLVIHLRLDLLMLRMSWA